MNNLQQQKILEADERKQDMYHYDGAGCTVSAGRSVTVYLLKAYRDSDRPDWDDIFNSCRDTGELDQYALGVYSKGEWREAEAHGERHTERTGEQYGIMETFLAL